MINSTKAMTQTYTNNKNNITHTEDENNQTQTNSEKNKQPNSHKLERNFIAKRQNY